MGFFIEAEAISFIAKTLFTTQLAAMRTKLLSLLPLLCAFILLAAFKSSNAYSTPKIKLSIDTFPFVQTIKTFKGQTVVSSSGPLTFSSGLHNDYYYTDSQNRVGYLYVEARLGDFKNINAKRLPLNIAIVIDRSGSMAGAKMKYAKEAAKTIIDKLTPEDFVSVVMYDHEVTVIQPSVHPLLKDSIKKKIDAIEERGSTNLWGGSEKGYEQVKKSFTPDYVNRVLLISDGLATSGLTNARIIQNKVRQYKDEEGITLSTFGVGLDYNEVLMTDMAESGAGNYYFINDLDKMASIFEKEINGLAAIATKDATLTIEVPTSIQLNKVYAHKADIKDNRISIKFRDLFANEIKGVLIQFQIGNAISGPVTFTSTLSFKDVKESGVVKQLENRNVFQATQVSEEVLNHYNRAVLEQTVLLQSNEALEKAMLEADKGLFEGARQSLLKNQAYLKMHEPLVQASKELLKMDSANRAYYTQLLKAEQLGGDTLKLMQKTNRAGSYKIRTRKQ